MKSENSITAHRDPVRQDARPPQRYRKTINIYTPTAFMYELWGINFTFPFINYRC